MGKRDAPCCLGDKVTDLSVSPCIFLLHLVLFSPLNTCSNRMCQNTGSPAVPSCHMLNQLSTQHFQIGLCSQTQPIYYSQPHTQASTKLKLLLEQWFKAQLEMFVHTGLTPAAAYTRLRTHLSMNCVVCHPWLWEALAGVREDSALLNPLRAHVQICMTWPSMASIQARLRCVCIPGKWESEREMEDAEWAAHEGRVALALETGQFILWILTDCDSLPD